MKEQPHDRDQQQPSGAPNGVAGGAQLPQPVGISSPGQTGASGVTMSPGPNSAQQNGGRFDFDDGGTFCGGWVDGKAHGHGVCTGPKNQGAYSGSWHYGFEVSGVYTWPSGSFYEGQWQNGKRHGLGMETRGRWIYRGEWNEGTKGRYGVRQSTTSTARYEGTWSCGYQDGYGLETYADGGTFQGQWLKGMRHGYGVRASAPFGLASHYKPTKQIRASLTSLRSADGGPATAPTPEPTDKRNRRVDDSRGGFVLQARSDNSPPRRKSLTDKSLKKGILSGLKIKRQPSSNDLEKRDIGGSIRSNASTASWMSTESSQSQASASVHTDSNTSFVIEDEQMDPSVTETYLGEWKNDKRTGFGISERSDGLRYEGEWFNNRKYGYGVTIFRDGSKEEGKYKNNILITNKKKKHIFLLRSAKFRERIEAAVNAAQRASKMSLQKADIAISRTSTARDKAELADIAAEQAREDSELAQVTALQFCPEFRQPGLERLKNRNIPRYVPPPWDSVPGKSILHKTASIDQPGPSPNKTVISDENSPSSSNSGPSHMSQLITQSIRRTSMKPAQNQIPYQNQVQNQISNQMSNQMPNQMPNQIPHQISSGQSQYSNPQTSLPSSNPYPLTNQLPQSQYTNNISNQFQQNRQQFPPNQYMQSIQSQYPGQGSQYRQSQYPKSNQQEQYNNYPTTTSTTQGFQNQYQQGFAGQQIMSPLPPVINDPMMGQVNQFGSQLYDTTIPNQYGSGQMNQYNAQQLYGQPQQQQYQPDGLIDGQRPSSATSIRRNSRILSPQDKPNIGGIGQTLNDRLDHYKRPPSRDSSVDRYTRAHSRLTGSRQPSVDKITSPTQDVPERSIRGPSAARAGTPLNGSVIGNGATTPTTATPTSGQFEGALLRNRNLGQDILPSPGQPKRTESLYIAPARGSAASGRSGGGAGIKAMPVPAVSLQRKKSLPDVAQPILLSATAPLSREEVSLLSSMRREEIRRQIDESERLRANPLLYLVSPQVKDWFSRQQLVMLVLFINISLALMFFKLLT